METGNKSRVYLGQTSLYPYFNSSSPARVSLNPALGMVYRLKSIYVPSYTLKKTNMNAVHKQLDSLTGNHKAKDNHVHEAKDKVEQHGSGTATTSSSASDEDLFFKHPVHIEKGTLKKLHKALSDSKKRKDKKHSGHSGQKKIKQTHSFTIID